MSEPAIQFETTGLQQITCLHCQRVYKLNKDGCPSKHFTNHLKGGCTHRFTDDQVREFRENYCNEQKQNQNLITAEPEIAKPVTEELEPNCVICYYPIKASEACSIPCKHIFHTACIRKMTNDLCPLCRNPMGINTQQSAHDFLDTIRGSYLHELQPSTLRTLLDTTQPMLLGMLETQRTTRTILEQIDPQNAEYLQDDIQSLNAKLSLLGERIEEMILLRRMCFILLCNNLGRH